MPLMSMSNQPAQRTIGTGGKMGVERWFFPGKSIPVVSPLIVSPESIPT